MSKENVEIVRRFYDHLARRDWDAVWRDFTPDFVLDTQVQGSYRGRDECQAFVEDQISAFESSTAEPVEVFEGGEHVAVFVKIRARPKESSAEIEALIGHLFTLRDGLIVRLQTSPSVRRPSKPQGYRSSRIGRDAAIRFTWKAALFGEILRGRCRRRTSTQCGLSTVR
jgi:ketosteroid isomerase-like protein